MTTSSKPTLGEWRRVHDHPNESCRASIAHIVATSRSESNEIATLYCCDIDPEQAANANLIAEAGTVYHETGLTPRQLAEQRAELLLLCRTALDAWTGDGPPVVLDDLRAAIARAEVKP